MKNAIFILLILVFSSCKSDRITIEKDKSNIFSNLYTSNNIASEYFLIDLKKDTTVLSKNGTLIRIYANSFKLETFDSLTTKIQIEVKEAYNPIEFVLGNLTTTSDNKLLSSGGMLYINASVNKENLKLKDGKEIGIIVPTNKLDEEMLIFQGLEDSTSVNWINENSVLNKQLRRLEHSYKTITYQRDSGINFEEEDQEKTFDR